MLAQLSLTLLASLPAAQDLYVDSAAVCSSADGSAAAPYCTIAEALVAAQDGDTIRIAPGSYVENLVVRRDVALLGTEGAEVTVIDGGGVGSTVEVQSSAVAEIEGLTLQNGFAAGGGLRNFGAVTLRNTTVSHNAALAFPGGGGIYQAPGSGPMTLDRCRVVYNEVLYGTMLTAGGGLIARSGGPVTLDQTQVAFNTAGWSGGIDVEDSPLVIRNSTIHDCCAASGYMYYAVRARNSPFEMTNSTISGNCGQGLAVITNVPVPRYLGNSTITLNLQIYGVGGVLAYASNGISGLPVRNTIIAQNLSNYGDADGMFVSLGHNLVNRVPAGAGFVPGANGDLLGLGGSSITAGLSPLAQNGGATPTHALLFTSPAIDAGDPDVFLERDQRGVRRYAQLTDIGAYEFDLGTSPAICLSNPNSTGEVGQLFAGGSNEVSTTNEFYLEMQRLPMNATGFFLVAPVAGFVAQPAGSAGNVCLGGTIGRLVSPGQVQSSGTDGRIGLQVDLSSIPNSTTFVATNPGDTWVFQGWHRDSVMGVATSNFTTAVEVVFQ